MGYYKKFINTLLFFGVLTFISMLWIIWNWPYTPADAIKDGAELGYYGVLIDIFVLTGLGIIWLRKPKKIE